MSYRPPTLSIAAQTLTSSQASVKRKYTDTLKLYRLWQDHDAASSDTFSRGEINYNRDRLRALSYRYRAYSRAIDALYLLEKRDVVRDELRG